MLAAALIGLGVLAIFSIGLPFLVFGVALLVLRPYRSRPGVFWPLLALIIGFFVGYALVAPFECSSTSGSTPGAEARLVAESCRSLIGIEYREARLLPGVAAGVAMAVIAGGWALLAIRRRTPDPGATTT